MDGTWDDYDPEDGGNVYTRSWRPAEALMFGKHYLYHWAGDGQDTLYTCRLFEWFGDPEMMLRLGVQSSPGATYPPAIPVGLAEVAVDCAAEGALVAVSENGMPLGKANVAGGIASITLEPAPVMPTTLDIVITGPNLVPQEGTIQVGWDSCSTPPLVATRPAQEIGGTRALLAGVGSPEGCEAICYFQYGLTSAYGSTTPAAYLGHSQGEPIPFGRAVTGLAPQTTYHFRAVLESGGGIETGADRTFTTTAVAPLQPPVLQAPAGGTSGQDPAEVTVQWQDANSQPNESGYQVRYRRSTDFEYNLLEAGPDTLACPLPALSSNALYWWNVRARGDGNLTSDSAWANGGTDWAFSTSGADVLIINGDLDNDFSACLTAAVQNAGYTFDLFLRASASPITLGRLTQYRAVVWSTGDDFSNIMKPDEESAFRTYLDGGGKLFLAGQDFLFPFYPNHSGTTAAGTFVRDYLFVDWFDSDIGGSNYYNSASGQDLLDGLGIGLGTSPLTTYFDYITPTEFGATLLAVPGTGYAAAIRSAAGVFRAAFMVCPFENITAEADRFSLMAGVLEWLLPPPVALAEPLLVAPAAEASGISTAPVLEWTDPNQDPEESYYEIRFKALETADYTLVQAAPGTTSLPLSGLLHDTVYGWSVRARGNGTSTTDSAWACGGTDRLFTTESLTPTGLLAPELQSPADAAIDQPGELRLEWTDPNGAPGEVQYEIRFRRASETEYTVTRVGANQTVLHLSGLELDSAWFWNVRALGNGISTLDSAWANGGVDWSFQEGVSGDADRDGDRDAADLVLLAQCLAGTLGPELVSLRNADLDGNGLLNGHDLVLLINLP